VRCPPDTGFNIHASDKRRTIVTQIDEELAELVESLVRIETENPPGNERPCAEFVRDWFDDRGIESTLVTEPDPDRPQAVGRVGDGDPTVVLNGHLDVVPAGDHGDWSHDPYGAESVGTDLYGRGSADMKAGVAIAMLTADRLRDDLENGEMDGTVIVHGAMGEETGDPGTQRLLETGYGGDYGIVLEPTGLRVGTRTKGTAWYTIRVGGAQSHASSPDQGSNAIRNAEPVLEALGAYDRRVRERVDDLLGSAYATVTEFEAGTKENIVPEEAVITLDRRVLPAEDFAEINDELDRVLADVAATHGIDVEWERFMTYAPCRVPDGSPLAETVRRHAAAVADVPVEPWAIPAGTDTRNFVNDAGIEAITWGPGALDQAHTVDEHVDLEEVTTGLEILEQSTRRLIETDPSGNAA
jgi:succinyl-diaminopimelate desuccinylase